MKKIIYCLAILFLISPLSAQNIQFETTEEIKSGSQNPLVTIGESEGKIYMAHVGSGKRLSEFKVLEFEANDIKSAPKEMELGAIFPDIKKHDVSYFFLQHGQIYIISLSNSQYFGNIMSLDGKAIKSNISLFAAGMTKTTVGFAEMQETLDKKQLVLIYKKGPKDNLKDIGLLVFDENLKSTGNYLMRLPGMLIKPEITDLYYGVNGCLYLSIFSEKTGGQAYVYSTASNSVTSYDLSDQDKKIRYYKGRFHEGPDGRVWLGFTKGEKAINSYTMFVHAGGSEAPILVENYEFEEQVQKSVRLREILGKDNIGLPVFAELNRMLFAEDGKMYAIFESNVTHYHPRDHTGQGLNLEFWTLFSLDLVCVSLDASGIAKESAVVFKAQKLTYSIEDMHNWTLGRKGNFSGLGGKSNTYVNALSFHAYIEGGKLHILMNDDRSNGVKNEEKRDYVDNLGKVNLVHVRVDGNKVEKEIIVESGEYELIFLSLLSKPYENGHKLFSAVGSKRGGQTGMAVISLY